MYKKESSFNIRTHIHTQLSSKRKRKKNICVILFKFYQNEKETQKKCKRKIRQSNSEIS